MTVQRRTALPVLVGATLALLLGACSVGGTETSSADTSGKLRVVIAQTPFSMDACDANHSQNGPLMAANIAESLTDLNLQTGEVQPKLATAWTQKNPTTWEFTLREGVKFHDGQDFNADAVAKWVNRIVNPKAGCYALGSVIDTNVLSANAVDAKTVDVVTKTSDPILPKRFAFVFIGAPTSDPLTKAKAPIGTGPYKFVSYSPGQDYKVTRFDGYWGPKPDVSAVDYAIRPESSVRAAMASAGEVDIATAIGPQDAKMPGAVNYTVSETLYYRMDVSIAPLNDIRVRRAMEYAIDRQTLINNVYGGLGKAANEIYLPTVTGYDPSVKWSYDPDQAKKLLAEAAADGVNVKTPIEVLGKANIRGSNGSEIEDTMSAMLKAVGFNTKVTILEDDKPRLAKPQDPSYKPGIIQNVHGNSIGDAYVSLQGKLSCDGPQSPICDKQFDALLATAGAASGAERETALQAADRYIFDKQVALIPVAHLNDTMVITNDKVEYTPNPATSEKFVISEIHLKK